MHEYVSSLMNGVVKKNKKAIAKLRACNKSMNFPPIVQEAIDFKIEALEDENKLIHKRFPRYFAS